MTWQIVTLVVWLTGLCAWAVRSYAVVKQTTRLMTELEKSQAQAAQMLERQKVLELAVANALAQMVKVTSFTEEKYKALMSTKVGHR